MNEATYNALKSRAETLYAEANGGPPKAGIDIFSIIISIIEAILSGGICPTPPKSGAALRTRAGHMSDFDLFSLRAATRSALREQYGFGAWRTYNGPAVAQTALKMATESDDAEAQAAMDFVNH